jgi:hypothetical protein
VWAELWGWRAATAAAASASAAATATVTAADSPAGAWTPRLAYTATGGVTYLTGRPCATGNTIVCVTADVYAAAAALVATHGPVLAAATLVGTAVVLAWVLTALLRLAGRAAVAAAALPASLAARRGADAMRGVTCSLAGGLMRRTVYATVSYALLPAVTLAAAFAAVVAAVNLLRSTLPAALAGRLLAWGAAKAPIYATGIATAVLGSLGSGGIAGAVVDAAQRATAALSDAALALVGATRLHASTHGGTHAPLLFPLPLLPVTALSLVLLLGAALVTVAAADSAAQAFAAALSPAAAAVDDEDDSEGNSGRGQRHRRRQPFARWFPAVALLSVLLLLPSLTVVSPAAEAFAEAEAARAISSSSVEPWVAASPLALALVSDARVRVRTATNAAAAAAAPSWLSSAVAAVAPARHARRVSSLLARSPVSLPAVLMALTGAATAEYADIILLTGGGSSDSSVAPGVGESGFAAAAVNVEARSEVFAGVALLAAALAAALWQLRRSLTAVLASLRLMHWPASAATAKRKSGRAPWVSAGRHVAGVLWVAAVLAVAAAAAPDAVPVAEVAAGLRARVAVGCTGVVATGDSTAVAAAAACASSLVSAVALGVVVCVERFVGFSAQIPWIGDAAVLAVVGIAIDAV